MKHKQKTCHNKDEKKIHFDASFISNAITFHIPLAEAKTPNSFFWIMDRFEDVSDCEVDHSFFDSDVDEELKKDGVTTEANRKENKEPPEMEGAIVDTPELKMEDDSSAGVKERPTESQEERTLNSGTHHPDNVFTSLPAQNSENASTSGSTVAQSKRQPIPAQIPQIVREQEENYYTDEEDSSDDSRSQRVRLKLPKQANSAKVSRNVAVSSSSSSSSSCSDTDSDDCLSDSSCSSSNKKRIGSLALLSPRQKRSPGIKSVEVKPKLGNYAEESEDTVTDVTPLSTPDISPIQSFELAASNDKKLKVKRQENVSQDLIGKLEE